VVFLPVKKTSGITIVLHQGEVSSCVETAANGIHFPVEVTGAHMKPVVLLEKLDLAR